MHDDATREWCVCGVWCVSRVLELLWCCCLQESPTTALVCIIRVYRVYYNSVISLRAIVAVPLLLNTYLCYICMYVHTHVLRTMLDMPHCKWQGRRERHTVHILCTHYYSACNCIVLLPEHGAVVQSLRCKRACACTRSLD